MNATNWTYYAAPTDRNGSWGVWRQRLVGKGWERELLTDECCQSVAVSKADDARRAEDRAYALSGCAFAQC